MITSYLITTQNLERFFDSLITAKAPEVFTLKFLQSLDFTSTNDRFYIGLLKGLGFLDANGIPTERYFSFLDQSQSKVILAEAVKEAYSELFAVNIEANELDVAEAKNKLRSLTQGKNSEKVLGLMANTFKALVDYADWDSRLGEKEKVHEKKVVKTEVLVNEESVEEEIDAEKEVSKQLQETQLHYNIQIHLPESRDHAVYDAIFRSLKKHLF